MTVQAYEILFWKEKQYGMDSYPLEDYFEQGAPRPDFVLPSTALRRGYQGTWQIAGDRLYLACLDCILDGGATITAATLFPGTVVPVLADWYSGALTVPTGKLLSSGYMGHNRVYAETTFISIEYGHVVGVSVRPYEPPPPVPVGKPKLTINARITQWLRGTLRIIR